MAKESKQKTDYVWRYKRTNGKLTLSLCHPHAPVEIVEDTARKLWTCVFAGETMEALHPIELSVSITQKLRKRAKPSCESPKRRNGPSRDPK